MGKKSFWLIIISLHALAGLKQLCFNTTSTRDSEEYLQAAGNLKTHGTLYAGDLGKPIDERLYTKRPPAYPLILAFFDLLSFGSNGFFLFLVLLAQNLLSLFNIRLISRMLLKDTDRIPWALFAILIILSPAQIIYANMVMSEIWLQTVIVLLCYLLIRYRDTFTYKNALYISLLLILAMLLKPVMAPLVFIFPLFALWYAIRKKRYALFLIMLLPVLSWSGYCEWNAQRTGYRHFSSISTINLLHYNTYGVLQKQYGSANADLVVDRIISAADTQPGFAAREQYINAACKNILSHNILSYASGHIKGMVFFFADPGRFDIVSFFGIGDTRSGLLEAGNTSGVIDFIKSLSIPLILLLCLIATGNVLKAAGLIVFSLRKQIPLYYRFILPGFILYICVLTGPIGASRFLMPLLPLVWLANMKLVQVMQNAKGKKQKN